MTAPLSSKASRCSGMLTTIRWRVSGVAHEATNSVTMASKQRWIVRSARDIGPASFFPIERGALDSPLLLID
jgi:hypothetical protein